MAERPFEGCKITDYIFVCKTEAVFKLYVLKFVVAFNRIIDTDLVHNILPWYFVGKVGITLHSQQSY